MQQLPFLSHIQNILRLPISEREKKKMLTMEIEKATEDDIESLAELCRNFLNGACPGTTKKIVQRLMTHRYYIRKLASWKTGVQQKKKFLLSHMKKKLRGGAFPLLPLITPIISSIIGGALSSAISS